MMSGFISTTSLYCPAGSCVLPNIFIRPSLFGNTKNLDKFDHKIFPTSSEKTKTNGRPNCLVQSLFVEVMAVQVSGLEYILCKWNSPGKLPKFAVHNASDDESRLGYDVEEI